MLRKLFFLLVLLSACKGSTQEAINAQMPIVGLSDAQLALIHENTREFPNGTQLAIALIDGPKTLFYGVERRQDTLFTVNNADALFEIGSITKVFTATLLAQEVVEGRLSLDQKVVELLDMKFNAGNDITLGQLASHTSGMKRLPGNLFRYVSDQNNPYKNYDLEALYDFLTNTIELNKKKEYDYSNTGVALLGHALSVYLEKSYQELIHSRILKPLQMTSTVFGAENAAEKLVAGLNPNGEPTSNWDLNIHAPAGGLISSVADLEKFARNQFDSQNKAGALSRKKIAPVREERAVALGWHINTATPGLTLFGHSGGTGGYTSVIQVDADQKKAVIILSNVSAFHKQSVNVRQLGGMHLMKTLY